MIGVAAYQREALVDPQTGIAPVSPWGQACLARNSDPCRPCLLVSKTYACGVRAPGLAPGAPADLVHRDHAVGPGSSGFYETAGAFVIQVLICIALTLAIRRTGGILAAMATACAIMVGVDLFSWIFLPTASMTEIGLTDPHHKNTLGSVMMYCCLVSVAYLQGRKGLARQAFWGSVVLAGFALLVASQSKRAWESCWVQPWRVLP